MNTMGMNGTKWKIFCTAVEMFAENNYAYSTMRDIADQVGIRASSIYNHFSSKDELLCTIFGYYDHYINQCLPDLNELLERAETEDPFNVLMACDIRFDPLIQPLMDKIIVIASAEMRHNPLAEMLVRRNLIESPEKYMTALLTRMVELKKIEPLDVNSFVLLESNYCYAAALRMYTSYPIEVEPWIKGLTMLFSLIKKID